MMNMGMMYQGMMNPGMLNPGMMMNPGMLNPGMMNPGMMNQDKMMNNPYSMMMSQNIMRDQYTNNGIFSKQMKEEKENKKIGLEKKNETSQKKLQAINTIKEIYNDLKKNPMTDIGLNVELVDKDDIFVWRCTLSGPKDTPYSNGLFYLRVIFTEDFPEKAPEVCFETPIYHVNINPKESANNGGEALGHVCISTLNWWSPIYSMKEVFNNIYALFYMNNPDSPYGIDRADELRNHKDLYDEKARYFTEKYAKSNRTGKDEYSGCWDFTYDKKK